VSLRWSALRVPLLMRSLGAQVLAAGLAMAALPQATPLAVAAAAGICAAVLGRAAGLAPWWLWINAGLPLLGVAAWYLAMPSWVYLAAAGVLFSVYGMLPHTRVPLYIARPVVADVLATIAPQRGAMIDLGCGTGTIPARLSRVRPGLRCVGVELGPVPWLISKLRSLGAAERFDVRYADMWQVNLAAYDLVYVFLSPEVMPRLWAKACREMRPGTWLASYAFEVPDAPPTRIVVPADAGGRALYLWRMPDPARSSGLNPCPELP